MNERVNMADGLYSSTMFEVLLDHEVARSKRYQSPITLLSLSAQTKSPRNNEINENTCLSVTQVFTTKLRQVDIPAHCGDNFWVLLPGTDEKGGIVVGKRLIVLLGAEQNSQNDQTANFKIAIGISSHPGGRDISGSRLMEQACLARQKASTKDQNSLVISQGITSIAR